MQIKKIHIENYRSFRDSGEQDITKLFALIGKNNSGKSTFVSAIQSVWGLRKLSNPDIHKNNGKPIKIKVVTEEIDSSSGEPKETSIVCEYSNEETTYKINNEKPVKKPPANLLPKLLVIPAIRNPQGETTAGSDSFLKDLVTVIVDLKAKDTAVPEFFKDKVASKLSLDEIKSLLEFKTSELIEGLGNSTSKYLQSSLEDESLSVAIRPEGDLSKAIKYSTKIKEPNLEKLGEVDVLNCGTGIQSMVIMAMLQTYADLQKQENSILLIEEPEVYLHPELQRKMFSVLRKIAERTQVIYTTHSPIMISDLWIDDSVRLITRTNGVTVISDIDIEGVIRELGIRYEDILNPKVVIFVEGHSDISFYKRVIKLKYPHLYSRLDAHIKFIDTGGFRNIHVFALMNILFSANVMAHFYMIADSDGKTREQRKAEICKDIKDRIKEHNFTVDTEKIKKLPDLIRILGRYAIESYFLRYELLKKINDNITKNDADYLIGHYDKCYAEVLEKKGTKRLRQSMKPKLFFEEPSNNSLCVTLSKDFKEDERFFSIRKGLVAAWKNKKIAGLTLSHCIVDENTINDESFSEPIGFLEEIMEKTGIPLASETSTVGIPP